MRAVLLAVFAVTGTALAVQGCTVGDADEATPVVVTVDSGVGVPAATVPPVGGPFPLSETDTAASTDVPASAPSAGSPATPAPSPGTPGATLGQAVPSAAPAQDPAEAVVRRAVRAYETARTARGTFEQTLNNPQTGTRSTSRGEFFRAQPDKFAFQFSDPRGDAIIADGTHVWLYLPSTNPGQVIRAPLSPSSTGAFDLGAMFFERPLERYTVADRGATTLDGRAVRAIQLTPKQRGGPFNTATVWIDADGALRQFAVVDGTGLERTVRITGYSPNATVNPSVFRFTPPAGVRVVDAPAVGQ